MIKVTVPATTANIGCGFDSLGCALSMYAVFTFEKSDKFIISGCDAAYQNEDNLVLRSYKKVFEKFKLEVIPVKLHIQSEIPLSRGLGSSAACIVAGIYGANAILDHPLSKEQCLELATFIEGHPDNVAPAIYGNLTASFVSEKVCCTRFQSADIEMLVMIPDFEVSTEKARKILPAQINFKDAIFNLSRVACLCKAFEENDQEMIHEALQDCLHEPYRKNLIDEYDEIKEICKDETAFFISGSGPTLICIPKHEKRIIQNVQSLQHHWTCKLLHIENQGAREEII